jgi:hypothetical protein
MRLMVYRNDPPGQPEPPALEPVVSEVCIPPQGGALSASDRQAVAAWAAKHGFALLNPVDEWLAEVAWRLDLESAGPNS